MPPTKYQIETLPEWAQRHIENVRNEREAFRKKLDAMSFRVEAAEKAERSIRLELKRAKRTIAELKSK